jgi:hypothetical protein
MMAEVKHASLPLQRINYERKSAIPSATEFCQKFGYKTFFQKILGNLKFSNDRH